MAVQALGGIKYIFLTHQDDGRPLPMDTVPTYHTTMPLPCASQASWQSWQGIQKGVPAVADHALWAQEFGAERIIHASECNSHQGTE